MRLPALLTAVLLTLGACGGDDPADPSVDAPTTAEEDPAGDDTGDGADDDAAEGAPDDAAADDREDDGAGQDETADEDGGEGVEDPLADGGTGVVLDVAGQRLTAGPDATIWACAATADASLVSFQFLDEAGNDVGVNHQADGETTASLTLADGTTWNAVEGGRVEVSQQGDAFGLTIEVSEVDSGESALLEGRLRCG